MANNKKRFRTELPTQPWTINRLRVDIVERLKVMSKVRNVTILHLVNSMLDSGLKQLEAVEARKREGRVENGE